MFPRIQSVIILDNGCHVDEILSTMSYYAIGDLQSSGRFLKLKFHSFLLCCNIVFYNQLNSDLREFFIMLPNIMLIVVLA